MTRVVVAARDLVPGAALQPGDLALGERRSDSLVADVETSTAAATGRTLIAPVHAGEVLRDRDLLDSVLLRALASGTVATPLRVADAAATALVRTGDVIDVIAAASGDGSGGGSTASASVVATGVRVLVVPSRSSGGDGSLFASSGDVTGSDGSLLVVATTTAQALNIARAGVRGRLSFIMRSG